MIAYLNGRAVASMIASNNKDADNGQCVRVSGKAASHIRIEDSITGFVVNKVNLIGESKNVLLYISK